MEHEADRAAERVMRMQHPDQAQVDRDGHGPCEACAGGFVRRQPAATPVSAGTSPAIVHRALRTPGHGLDPATRGFFEARFGEDFGHVRLHTDALAGRSARAVQALAYTVGNHIFFADGQAHRAATPSHLLGHELAHVVQQQHGAAPLMLARAHDPHQPASSRSVSLNELHDILVKLLTVLKRKTQLSIMGFKTIAIGLVEGVDENGRAFQTLVYTASGNWGSVDLETEAEKLGITRWIVGGRAEGRGAVGAPVDAEQLLIDGQDEADMTLLGMAVSRQPCLDCAEAIRDEDVATVFVDPSKHLPKRERERKPKPSAGLQTARGEIDQAFGPQVVAPGQEATTGLGPKSSLWGALDVLNMSELYRVLEEADRKGRLSAIAAKTNQAEAVDNNRLLAPMDAILLKKENLSQTPDGLRQALVSSLLMQRLALLPSDQSGFLLNQLYPSLKLATPRAPVAPKQKNTSPKSDVQPAKPKKESPAESAKEKDSFVGPIIKGLAALGVTAAAIDAVADVLLTIAGKVFTDVVLRIVVEGASKLPVREAIKQVAETAVKDAGPKLRVLSEAARRRLPDLVADELDHVVEDMTRSYLKVPGP
jgi:hypothetical protein